MGYKYSCNVINHIKPDENDVTAGEWRALMSNLISPLSVNVIIYACPGSMQFSFAKSS